MQPLSTQPTTLDTASRPPAATAHPPHLRVRPGQAGEFGLLVNDPAQVLRAAQRLAGGREVACHREYLTWVGRYAGLTLSISSVGTGGPAMAIAMEELAQAGTHTLVVLGDALALQPGIQPGDLLLAIGAMRHDGTSAAYAPAALPAVPHFELTQCLSAAANHVRQAHDRPLHQGLVASHDAPYAQSSALLEQWRALRLLALDLTSAGVFTVAHLRGMAAAALAVVTGSLADGGQAPHVEGAVEVAWDVVLEIALEGLARYARRCLAD